MIIRSRFLAKRMSSGKTWAVALCLGTVMSLGSTVIYFLFTFQDIRYSFLEGYDQSFLSIFNPFPLLFQLGSYSYGSSYQLYPQSYGALVWTAALTPYLIYWVLSRLVHFSPEPTEEDKQLMALVEQQAAENR